MNEWMNNDYSTSILPKAVIHAHDDYILACTVSPNNKLVWIILIKNRMIATASADRSIKLWNRDTQECITKLIGHEVYEFEGKIDD